MRRLIRSLSVSGGVGALLSSAVVLAQSAKPPGPFPAHPPTVSVEFKVFAAPAAVIPANGQAADEKPKPAGKKKKGTVTTVIRQSANRAPLIQQAKGMVRPAVRAELILALRACQLSREELRRIHRDAQSVADDVIGKVVDAQLQPRVIVAGRFQSPGNLDAGKQLQDALSDVLKKDLTPEQWSKYVIEREKRDANRKRCTIRFMVDAIDRELYLSQDQRTKLEGSLSANWDASWPVYVDYFLYGNQFYPMAVDPLLSPILTGAQKTIWRNVQKVDRFWGFTTSVWGGFGNDIDDLEVEMGEEPKRPAEHGKAASAVYQLKAVKKASGAAGP